MPASGRSRAARRWRRRRTGRRSGPRPRRSARAGAARRVFTETLSAPASSRSRTCATSLTPPPTVTGTSTCSAARSTASQQRAPVLVAGGDVEPDDLVGALLGVAHGGLDRVAAVAQVDEVDALDDAPARDVEAGDDAPTQHRPTAATARSACAGRGPSARGGTACRPRAARRRGSRSRRCSTAVRASTTSSGASVDGVGVREVAGRGQPGAERVVGRGGLDVVPAHVRQAARAVEPRDRARQQPEAGHVALAGALEQSCRPDADAEQAGAAGASAASIAGTRPRACERRHGAARPRRRPGITTSARAAHARRGRRSPRTLRADALEGGAQRAQVARAVVDQHDAHRTPLVLETPSRARGRAATAWRSASASALNAASTTWWSSLAARRHVQADARAAREGVEEVGEQARRARRRCARSRSPRSMPATPRPERSTVACAERLVERRAGSRRSGTARRGRRARRRALRRARSRSPRRCGARPPRGRPRSVRSRSSMRPERERREHVVEEARGPVRDARPCRCRRARARQVDARLARGAPRERRRAVLAGEAAACRRGPSPPAELGQRAHAGGRWPRGVRR